MQEGRIPSLSISYPSSTSWYQSSRKLGPCLPSLCRGETKRGQETFARSQAVLLSQCSPCSIFSLYSVWLSCDGQVMEEAKRNNNTLSVRNSLASATVSLCPCSELSPPPPHCKSSLPTSYVSKEFLPYHSFLRV